jgi:hypothetical protein
MCYLCFSVYTYNVAWRDATPATAEYTDAPKDWPSPDDLEIVGDFLPRPEDLVFKGSKVTKITITLDNDSLEFFKAEPKRLGTPYQRMIRNLVSSYVGN